MSLEEEQRQEGLLREMTFDTHADAPWTIPAWAKKSPITLAEGLDELFASVRPMDVEDFIAEMDEPLPPYVYIAGPMSGIPDFNFPAFTEAAEMLRELGFEVINPAENHDGATDRPLEDYFALDLPQVCRTDALVVLPGWQNSGGARIEVQLARHLGHPVLDIETLEPYVETAVQEAQRLVHGDRGVAYGHPADDFARTGKMWGAILGLDPIPPEIVGLCMAAVKISREVNAPKRDNRVDLAGYAETIEMIHQRQTQIEAEDGQ